MTEEQKPGAEVPTEGETPESSFAGELQSLGEQLATAVKGLWESEDSRKLRQEIGDGFVELGKQIDEAVKSAQESEAAKQFSEQVRGTVEKARTSDVTGKLERGLAEGLRELNRQLSKFVDSLEKKDQPKDVPDNESDA